MTRGRLRSSYVDDGSESTMALTHMGATGTTDVMKGSRSRSSSSIVWIGLSAVLGLYALASSQPNAAADMRPLYEFEWSFAAFSLAFIVNFPLNLLAYSTLLLILCRVWKRSIGMLPKDAMDFVGRVLPVVLVITILGVLIDFVFLYNHDATRTFYLDPLRWLAASTAIGLSVWVLSIAALRVEIAFGAVLGAAMGCFNLVGWLFTYASFESSSICFVLPGLFAAALSVLPLVYLFKWHKKAFVRMPTRTS